MWKLPQYNETIDWNSIFDSYQWIRDMRGVQQDDVHHAEGDVEVHTRMVLEALICIPEYKLLSEQEKSILFTAALLHDVEKRSTTVIEDGRITSPRHAKKGEFTARTILYQDITAPFEIREQISKLVRYHGLPIWIAEKPDSLRALVAANQMVDTKLLYILAKADMIGRKCADMDDMLYRVEFFKEFCIDNNCFGKKTEFSSDLARYKYLSGDGAINYEPFDDTKFEVILMSGVPGAGKDTVIEKKFSGIPVVSLDDLRRKHKIKHGDTSGNGRMVQLAKEEAKVNMRAKQSFIWNGTNITRDMRSQLIELFVSYGGRVRTVYVESSYKQLVSQNAKREYSVPVKAIDKLIAKLDIPDVTECHTVEYIIN